MTTLKGTRFGSIDVSEDRAVTFPRGLIGFPAAHRYVLLEPPPGRTVAWLQSLDVPELAFPVVDGSVVTEQAYPAHPDLAKTAGLEGQDVAVLIVVAPRKSGELVANLLAPLVVDLGTRTGAQVVLDHRRYSASERLAVTH